MKSKFPFLRLGVTVLSSLSILFTFLFCIASQAQAAPLPQRHVTHVYQLTTTGCTNVITSSTSHLQIRHLSCTVTLPGVTGSGTHATVRPYSSTGNCRAPEGDTICLNVNYTVNGGSVYISQASLTGYTSYNPWYWDYSKYGTGSWGAGFQYIGTRTVYQNINDGTHHKGLTFEPFVYNGSNGNEYYWDSPGLN